MGEIHFLLFEMGIERYVGMFIRLRQNTLQFTGGMNGVANRAVAC